MKGQEKSNFRNSELGSGCRKFSGYHTRWPLNVRLTSSPASFSAVNEKSLVILFKLYPFYWTNYDLFMCLNRQNVKCKVFVRYEIYRGCCLKEIQFQNIIRNQQFVNFQRFKNELEKKFNIISVQKSYRHFISNSVWKWL